MYMQRFILAGWLHTDQQRFKLVYFQNMSSPKSRSFTDSTKSNGMYLNVIGQWKCPDALPCTRNIKHHVCFSFLAKHSIDGSKSDVHSEMNFPNQ